MTAESLSTLSLTAGPQPLGIFPLPLGLLLLPEAGSGAIERGALEALLRGDLEAALPAAWRFFAVALRGEGETALALLERSGGGVDGWIGQYDRLILAPSLERYAALRERSDAGQARLLESAAYALGLAEEVPPLAAEEAAATPEVEAVVAMVRAAWCLERELAGAAAAELARAVPAVLARSPLLAVQLLAQLAELRREGEPAAAIGHYREALRLVEGAALPQLAADLWLRLGVALHEASAGGRGALIEAVQAYQEALHAGLTIERDPDGFALAQNNLGLAYLAMPMTEAGDALRMAVAVQSFREALKVYGRESHTEAWASTQLNLANALQYLPSSHPEENLIQAVEIYEELLSVRERAYDPVGYARLLANQANALAHLGVFGPALQKLEEAHKLFHWHGEPELAASALEAVHRINERRAESVEASGRPAGPVELGDGPAAP